MKLETLNIWGGRLFEPLTQHVETQAREVDIFCFQEVYSTPTNRICTTTPTDLPIRTNIHQEIAQVLPDYHGYYRSAHEGFDNFGKVDFELYWGLSIFVAKNVHVDREGEIFVFREKNSTIPGDSTTVPKNLQYIQFTIDGKSITVANLHGLWNGKGKTDTPDRIAQSRKVKTFLDNVEGAKILCGDFNLTPETESLAILEEGMVNLVKQYGVTSTRSDFYPKPERFADYILVSPDVNVIDFKVLEDQVSDHLPLYLEFN